MLRISKGKGEEDETFTWCVVYRNGRGQKRRWGLGRWPDLDYKDARNLATQMQGDIARGIDPVERRREQQAETAGNSRPSPISRNLISKSTVRSCKRPSSTRTDRLMLENVVVPNIGRKRAALVTRDDIAWLLKQVENGGDKNKCCGNRVRSNRVRSVISSMFSYAVEERMLPANPALWPGQAS